MAQVCALRAHIRPAQDPPVIYVPEDEDSEVYFHKGHSVDYDIPDKAGVLPKFVCTIKGRQRYRIVFFGEKSSLSEILRPIAEQIGAEMSLCTGEASITRVEEIARRASIDGRPLVILYFGDFDPSGWQMSISVARKIQACKELDLYPDLDAQVHSVALNLEQIKEFGLPETPMKDEEDRGENWKKRWGHEQTEIDSLLALHPEALRDITMEAIKPFFDDTLEARSRQAWTEWNQKATSRLRAHPEYRACRDNILGALTRLQEASEDLVLAQSEAYVALREVEPPHPVVPQPNLTASAPDPIYSTEDDHETASLKLIKRKRLL
jgi:hypothetical protein